MKHIPILPITSFLKKFWYDQQLHLAFPRVHPGVRLKGRTRFDAPASFAD